jgi:hypothetical protein
LLPNLESKVLINFPHYQQPYHDEQTSSRTINEV